MLAPFLCLTVALGAPPPKSPDRPVYFPTEVGTNWETVLSSKPGREEHKYSFSVDTVTEKDGETLISLKRHDTKFPSDGGKYKLTKDGVFNMGSSQTFSGRTSTPLVFDPPLPVLKYPIKKDATWEWKGKYGDDER